MSSGNIQDKGDTSVGHSGFEIGGSGAWQGEAAAAGHLHDSPLAQKLSDVLKQEKICSVTDLGAGMGHYTKKMRDEGLSVACFDGNPATMKLTQGRCAVFDFTYPMDITASDLVLSFEVGEHIPVEKEDIFLTNLVKTTKRMLIISWGVPGQGGDGHVNLKTNADVIALFKQRGLRYREDLAASLRGAATFSWFKNTIMVFERETVLRGAQQSYPTQVCAHTATELTVPGVGGSEAQGSTVFQGIALILLAVFLLRVWRTRNR